MGKEYKRAVLCGGEIRGVMRLDFFLKKTLVVKRRSVAKELCDRGMVKVDGKVTKASHRVAPGETIEIQMPLEYIKVNVLAIPDGNVSRKNVTNFVEVVREKRSLDI